MNSATYILFCVAILGWPLAAYVFAVSVSQRHYNELLRNYRETADRSLTNLVMSSRLCREIELQLKREQMESLTWKYTSDTLAQALTRQPSDATKSSEIQQALRTYYSLRDRDKIQSNN